MPRTRKAERPAPEMSVLLDAAKDAANMPRKHFLDLAVSLAALHQDEPENFPAMIGVAGISLRRLYYYRDVGRFVAQHAVSKANAESLGWTRLSIVARHAQDHPDATDAEVAGWLGLATHSTAHELPAALGAAERRSVKDRALLFRLSPEDYQMVENALLEHKAMRRGKGLAGKEAALVAMAHEAIKAAKRASADNL